MSANDPPPLPEESLNPYTAPTANVGDFTPLETGGDIAEAEAIRRKYLNHEASVKSLGSLHILGGVLTTLALIPLTASFVTTQGELRANQTLPLFAGLVVVYGLLSAYNLGIGIGLRKLQPWARWVEVVMQGLGLLFMLLTVLIAVVTSRVAGTELIGYGIGGLIGGYIFYLVASANAAMVFSPYYKQVIAKTPHIQYRTSCLVRFLVVLFIALLVFAGIGAYFAVRRG